MVFLADENFNTSILRGLKRRAPELELVTAPELGLRGADDSAILERAAGEAWVVLTHDARTMTSVASERLHRGLPMPGLVIIRQSVPVSEASSGLLLLGRAAKAEDLDRRILFLPL